MADTLTTADGLEYIIRRAFPSDHHWISNEWFRAGGHCAKCQSESYKRRWPQLIKACLTSPTTHVLIAESIPIVTEEDPDPLPVRLGYVVWEDIPNDDTHGKKHVLHHIGVVDFLRNQKIATSLMVEASIRTPMFISHKTPMAVSIMGEGYTYDPLWFSRFFSRINLIDNTEAVDGKESHPWQSSFASP